MSRRYRIVRRIGVIIVAALMTLGMATSVAAHENREVGEFEFTVGFVNEPAYVDQLNGIQLNIARAGSDGEPVENAHESLQATIIYGEETMDVELRPVFGEPGAYTADVIPTSTGTYSFRFVGEIEGQEVDETFRGGPDTFSEVEARDELEFPADAAEPAGESDQAMAIGIAGVAAGLLGLVAGAAGYMKASGSTRQPADTRGRGATSSEQPSE